MDVLGFLFSHSRRGFTEFRAAPVSSPLRSCWKEATKTALIPKSVNHPECHCRTWRHDRPGSCSPCRPSERNRRAATVCVCVCKTSNLRGMGVASSVLYVPKETAVMIRTNIAKHDLWDLKRMRVICLVWPFISNSLHCTAQMGPRGEILHWLELTKADTHISCCSDCMYSRQRNENNLMMTPITLFSWVQKIK